MNSLALVQNQLQDGGKNFDEMNVYVSSKYILCGNITPNGAVLEGRHFRGIIGHEVGTH